MIGLRIRLCLSFFCGDADGEAVASCADSVSVERRLFGVQRGGYRIARDAAVRGDQVGFE